MTVVFLLVLILALGVGFVITVQASRGRAARRRAKGPACGRCGYSVVGLGRMTCPECGADLRAAGIVTPRTPPRGSGIIGASLLFTALLGFIAIVASAGIYAVLPLHRVSREQFRLIGPQSGGYVEAAVTCNASAWTTKSPGGPIEVELVQALPTTTRFARLTVHPDGGYEFRGPGGRPYVARPGGFGPAAVREWMKASGLNPDAPTVAAEASAIAGRVRHVRRLARQNLSGGGMGYSMSSSSGGGGTEGAFASTASTEYAERQPPARAMLLVLGFWAIVWAAGLRFLTDHRRVAQKAYPRPAQAADAR